MIKQRDSKFSLWVKCPDCKKVYGVSPEIAAKYYGENCQNKGEYAGKTEWPAGKENPKEEG